MEVPDIYAGDVVTTSYGTGPFEVAQVTGPRLWEDNHTSIIIWPYPVVSLLISYLDGKGEVIKGKYGTISNVHKEPDGRYLTDVQRWGALEADEVKVLRRGEGRLIQLGLFAKGPDPEAEPYPFAEGVEYGADGTAWKCIGCGADFNGEREQHRPPWHEGCEKGYAVGIPIIVMAKGPKGPVGAYVRSLG